MKLEVNGTTHVVDAGATAASGLRPLLELLREELGVTGPKAGCQEGSCGTCTVLVDGQPRRACLVPVASVDGASISTVEGIGDPVDPHPVQRAFQDHYAAQCGFCTPGMIMATIALLDRTATPTESDLVDTLDGHVCRCTGYVKILDAIRAAAEGAGERRSRQRTGVSST